MVGWLGWCGWSVGVARVLVLQREQSAFADSRQLIQLTREIENLVEQHGAIGNRLQVDGVVGVAWLACGCCR